jgi:hypothetical protein
MTIRDTQSTRNRLFPIIAVLAVITAGGAVAIYFHQHQALSPAAIRTSRALAAHGWSPA